MKQIKFHLAMAGYTYNKFSIDHTLKELEKFDVHYLCVKDFHLPFDATAEQITEFKRKCADHGVTPYGAGPISMNTPDEAKKMGAMALFGEKYGSIVRVVKIGSSSTELCGGTHASNTGELGLFKIISESSVAAGIRRIEGTTGLGVLALLSERDELIHNTAKELKAQNPAAIAKRAQGLQAEMKELRRELDSANAKLTEIKTESLLSSLETVGAFKLLLARVDMRPDAARALSDTVKSKYPDGVAVFAAIADGKLNFVAAAGSEAVKAGAHAGNILREISAICGGKGGGRPDSAMSGGRDLDKIEEALSKVEELLK
jgi:alanyl-tRNA synthetase